MSITSKIDTIEVNGVSSDTVGVYVDTFPFPPMPERVYQEYDAGNGSENNVYAESRYKDVQITLNLYLFDGEYNPNSIYEYLQGAKTLRSSRFPDYEYRVKKVSGISPVTQNAGKRKLSVTFTCSPFRYAYDNPEEVLENGQYFHNSGSIFSRPKWRIYNIRSPFFLNVNGEQFSINLSGGETVVVDTDRMIAYSGVDVVLSKTTGNLPLLATGSNQISWTGDVDRVTIQKNERWV